MEKILNFIKKYKLYILSILLLIFMVRSCQNSSESKKLKKKNVELSNYNDSLINVNNHYKDTIVNFPKIIDKEKFNLLIKYDDYISKQDRGSQLMEIHMMIKNDIKELQK